MAPDVAKAIGRISSGLYIVTAAHNNARSAMVASWVSQVGAVCGGGGRPRQGQAGRWEAVRCGRGAPQRALRRGGELGVAGGRVIRGQGAATAGSGRSMEGCTLWPRRTTARAPPWRRAGCRRWLWLGGLAGGAGGFVCLEQWFPGGCALAARTAQAHAAARLHTPSPGVLRAARPDHRRRQGPRHRVHDAGAAAAPGWMQAVGEGVGGSRTARMAVRAGEGAWAATRRRSAG